jgi:hypothetical protein
MKLRKNHLSSQFFFLPSRPPLWPLPPPRVNRRFRHQPCSGLPCNTKNDSSNRLPPAKKGGRPIVTRCLARTPHFRMTTPLGNTLSCWNKLCLFDCLHVCFGLFNFSSYVYYFSMHFYTAHA